MAKAKFNIKDSRHPEYLGLEEDWKKFRLVWEGGEKFKDEYLKKYSLREDDTDFRNRKEISPISGFASAAITDIKNAIFQRMSDITRVNGSELYANVMSGKLGGIDLLGATINYFVGDEILPELLFMGKVGVFVDMPVISERQTRNETRLTHPYYYIYKTEDILNWRLSKSDEAIEFDMLLLRERVLTYDDVYALPDEDIVRYRLLTRENGTVIVRFFDANGVQIDIFGNPSDESTQLGITRIPFTIFGLKSSLLQNIANHQIALLNLDSSDVGYALISNFPFYTEQQSGIKSPHIKSHQSELNATTDDNEIEVGGTVGRSYPKGADRPDFIHPSSEPLVVSMKKQGQLKEDIRTLIQLALSAIQPKYASAEAKQFDEHGLESGLSFLGLVLEHGERQLASYFAEYESTKDVAIISYPDRYSLKSDTERLNEADKLSDILVKIPSLKAQKALTKIVARKLLDTKLPQSELAAIYKEIEGAKYVTSEPETIHSDLEKGLVSTETASTARGYDAKTEVPKAAEDHAERIRRIKDAQSDTRGVNDLSADNTAKDEKLLSQNPDNQDDAHKPVRGKEK